MMKADTRPVVLVVDDREDMVRFCERSLGDSYAFRLAAGGRAAAELLRREPCAAVLLDRDFSHADPTQLLGPSDEVRDEGLHILRWLRREHPRLPVIMVTGVRELAVALAAAELGADFLAWEDVTADPGILPARLQRALESGGAHQESMLAPFRELGIVVESPAFARALDALARAIPGRAPILLLGGTGTGKDSLAYAVHALAGDPSRPYVSVNVSALNPGLVESELFGHARGAFTGAAQASLGKLRFAHGGTLFLNEIGDLAPELQVKLLTAIERAEVVPVGDVRSLPADFRLITATSRDLRLLVESGQFRRDLLHRIAWHTIEIPPLRERTEDIPALAHTFLRMTARFREGAVLGIAREALQYLTALPWGGNVRELRGVIEAACAQARYTITVGDVREVVRRHEGFAAAGPAAAAPAATTPGVAPSTPDRAAAEETAFGGLDYDRLTAAYFFHLMRRTGGQLAEVARLAGIGKTTAYEWRKRYAGGHATTPPPPADDR